VSSKVTLQIVASLIDAAGGVIYDRNMAIPHVYGTGVICDDRSFIIQATGQKSINGQKTKWQKKASKGI